MRKVGGGAGGGGNIAIGGELGALARKVGFAWIREAVIRVDELIHLLRRNIQKTMALDALVVELRGLAGAA